MAILAELSSAQLAEHLRDPQGENGLAVAEALIAINACATTAILDLLHLKPAMAVLELGCGLGDFVVRLTESAPDINYTGLDRSTLMIDAALIRHRRLVDSGYAKFACATSEDTEQPDGSFDRLFSIGLVHFWSDPLQSLTECLRVLRPGGAMLMACLGIDRAPPFALLEHGFYLRSASEWSDLTRKAGFDDVSIKVDDAAGRPQGLVMMAKR